MFVARSCMCHGSICTASASQSAALGAVESCDMCVRGDKGVELGRGLHCVVYFILTPTICTFFVLFGVTVLFEDD